MRGILIYCFCFIQLGLHAQARLFADSTDLLIGDQVNIYLRVPSMQNAEWINVDNTLPDTIQAVEVLESIPMRVEASALVKQWRVGIYDTGIVRIPPLEIIIDAGTGHDTLISNDLPFSVRGVSDTTQVLAPIKDIIIEPHKLSDYLIYILVPAGAVLLLLAGWLIVRRLRKQKQINEELPEIVLPPHTIAMDKLYALEDKKLWQQGKVKEYHSELNFIIREYIERRFGLPALESVTGDILKMLNGLNLDNALENDLRDMLQAEDLIKFAKAEPPVEVHAQYMDLARSLVNKTKRTGDDTGTQKEVDHV